MSNSIGNVREVARRNLLYRFPPKDFPFLFGTLAGKQFANTITLIACRSLRSR